MRMLSLSLVVALTCLTAPVAEASSFDSPARLVDATVYQCGPSGCTNSPVVGSNPAPGAWDVDGTNPDFPGNRSFQHSLIDGAHAEGNGGISLALASSASYSNAVSRMSSTFTLDAPAILAIDATVSFTQNAAALGLG